METHLWELYLLSVFTLSLVIAMHAINLKRRWTA